MVWKKKISKVRKFDIFYKTERSIQVKSKYGGFVTLLGIVGMLILSIYEFSVFRSVETIESITVDTSRELTISVRFDITFHEMSCKDVTIDFVDQNNNLQLTQPDDIIKTPTDSHGILASSDIPINENGCGPCHNTGYNEQCCSCDDVKKYHSSKSWINEKPEKHPLCRFEISKNEGCRVKGSVVVLKGTGNFHLAPGISTTGIGGAHTHTLNPFSLMTDLQNTRLSHTIHTLSFGETSPIKGDTLNGIHFNTIDIVRHIYYIRLVPTIYIDGNKNTMRTYQYSVTNHTEVIDLDDSNSIQLPGVFFKYDLSPMLVKLETKKKHFTHFLTRLCAVVGGTWVVLGLVYSVFQQFVENIQKKNK